MKIGLTCYPGVGGSGILATRLGIELAKKNNDVHFITYERPFAVQGIDHENIHIHLVSVLDYPLFKYPPYTISLGSEMVRISQKENLDVINVHYSIPHATAAWINKQMTKVPYVVTLHGSDVTILGSDPSYLPVNNYSVEQADAVTAVSDFMRREAYERLGVEKEVKVIPNFVDSEIFKPADCKTDIKGLENNVVIIHVSNFRSVKRVPDLIYAMKIVTKENKKAKLILVGDGPERHNVERLIDHLNLNGSVRITGFRSDVANLMRCSDIGVLSSETESAPLTLLEGMSSGLPMIATNVGGIPEIIKNEINGLIVPPKNPEAIAKQLITLVHDSNLREKIGKKARETIIEKYTSTKVVDQYIQTFEEILKFKD